MIFIFLSTFIIENNDLIILTSKMALVSGSVMTLRSLISSPPVLSKLKALIIAEVKWNKYPVEIKHN